MRDPDPCFPPSSASGDSPIRTRAPVSCDGGPLGNVLSRCYKVSIYGDALFPSLEPAFSEGRHVYVCR